MSHIHISGPIGTFLFQFRLNNATGNPWTDQVNFEVELEVNLKINLGVTLGSSSWTYPKLKEPSYVKISLSLKLEEGDKKVNSNKYYFNPFYTVS